MTGPPLSVQCRASKSLGTFVRRAVTILVCSVAFLAKAQHIPTIDSLQKKLSTAKSSDSVTILNQISWEYRLSNSQQARIYANQALALAEGQGNTRGQADALRRIGVVDYVQGKYPAALQRYLEAAHHSYRLSGFSGKRKSDGHRPWHTCRNSPPHV